MEGRTAAAGSLSPGSMSAMLLFRFMKFSAAMALIVVAALVFSGACAPAQVILGFTDPQPVPVTVQSADVSTEVMGRLAVTTFDIVFANPNARELEGTFEFPLQCGQHVVRFALDFDGALREAVPVVKEKGGVVVSVVRGIEGRERDAGQIAKTGGNRFSARIFPIPANGTRRVVIAYQEHVGERYRLELNFPKALKVFGLTAKVFSAAGAAPPTATTTLALVLPAWRDGKILHVERENFIASGVLKIELSAMPVGEAEPAVITESFNGREYFYAELNLPTSMRERRRPVPKAVGILWDASGSGRERDHGREFALLDAWFAAVGDVDVKLILLRNTAAAPVTLTVRDGNWGEVRAALEKAVYDGASSFDGLADDPSVDEWLLFSGGLVNFGVTQTLDKPPLRAPVHAVNASTRAAPAFLRGLAGRGGGEYVDLLTLKADAAAGHLRQLSRCVLSVEANPGTVAQVVPEAGGFVTGDGDVLAVTGILRQPSATVAVKLGYPGAVDVAEVREFSVKSGEGASTLAARGWARAKIDHLSASSGDNRADIRAIAREFRIATADTSPIVLDTVDDYIRHDIEPPADLREEWLNRRCVGAEGLAKGPSGQIERLLKLFQERVAWYETEFPKEVAPRSAEIAPTPAKAQGPGINYRVKPQPPHPRPHKDAHMMVWARMVDYDYDNLRVAAVGSVMIYHNGTALNADKITYDQKTRRLRAEGSEVMTAADGRISRAEGVDLSDDYRDGFVDSLRPETADRLMVGLSCRRQNNTVFENGVSARPAKAIRRKPPFWHVTAGRIIRNQQVRMRYFEDAHLEFIGVPIEWLPYFDTPSPACHHPSCFLAPGNLSPDQAWTWKHHCSIAFQYNLTALRPLAPPTLRDELNQAEICKRRVDRFWRGDACSTEHFAPVVPSAAGYLGYIQRVPE